MRIFVYLAAVVATTACATPGSGSRATSDRSLYVAPDSYDFTKNRKLLDRIQRSPHGYFRFINKRFSQQVCLRIEAMLRDTPTVNLHGDAHLEQYAITDLGRGLTDFDDAATGPAPIDLLRFGVSLSLATEAHGWTSRTPALLKRFLAGYRAALEDPEFRPEEPTVSARVRASFETDRPAYFEWIESISGPLTSEARGELVDALRPYAETMAAENPSLRPEFFEVVDAGRLRMGIGSALDEKFLVRVEGPTDAPNDDVVLEVKEVRDLTGVSCVSTARGQDPFRILVAQSRIAYRPYRFLGYARLHRRIFWIHAWVDNYRELSIGETVRSPEELAEVVYDVGVQLGRGHPNQIAAPLDLQLRQALLQGLDEHEDAFYRVVDELAADTISAWRQFRAASGADEAG